MAFITSLQDNPQNMLP
jgi:hypothetical protein